MKNHRIAIALLALALLSSLTALAASAQGTPTVSFKAPTPNQNVVGPDVTISWDASPELKLVAAASATALTDAHFHLFLDKDPGVQDNVAIPAGDPQIIHTAAKEYKWTNVAPGKHTATLVLGYSNHTPWLPRTTATLSFNVVTTLPATGADVASGAGWLALALLLAAIFSLALGFRLRATR